MTKRRFLLLGALIGMTVGGVLPAMWGDANFFGAMSIGLATLGGLLGIWAMYKLGKYLDL